MRISSKTAIVILVLACVVLASGLGWAVVNYNSLISQKEAAINEKDSTIASLNSQIALKETQIYSLNSQVSHLSMQVNTLQKWLDGNRTLLNQVQTWLRENITSLENQVSSANTQITMLQNQVSNLNNQISLLDTQMKSLQNQIDIIRTAQDATKIFQFASPSVVQIKVYDKSYQLLVLGSGFVYDDQGHVITNNHVVEGGYYFIITTYDYGMFEAYLVGTDPNADLAVLKANLPTKYPPLKLADTITVGEPVYAIGSPFGLTESITAGIVSQLNRTVGELSFVPLLQTDAASNPGNSGGPLLNSRGEVLGVIVGGVPKYVSEGIGFAVPSTIIKKVVPNLIKYGAFKYPYIGIIGIYLDPIIANYYGLPKSTTSGYLILEIVYNSPAYKSDLRVKDVIIAIDNYPIRKDPDLNYLLAYKYSPGDTVVLTVIRDGKTVNISLTLAERP